MPLSELLVNTGNPKHTGHQSTMNSSSSTPFYMSDNEYAELLWENGQIVTHDHSGRPKRIAEKIQARDSITNSTSNSKGKNAALVTNDFPGNGFLGTRDEDIVPWIGSPVDRPLRSSPFRPDLLQADFCSDFLEEFAGANLSTLDFTSTPPTGTSTGAGTELSKGDTGLTNFSLFKDRLASGAKASTSMVCGSELKKVPDKLVINASEKDNRKMHEPVVASSSVCSVNSEGFENTEPKHAGKRKIREGEESSSNSEEMEDESVRGKKVAICRGASAKKCRAAEVHNLSERRRRERINEKLKALQELVPNCSKADKASMLDDAIEYLKSLQLQVQMMSMGSGVYMPPAVMMPPTMQPLQVPPMAHFSAMGLGLGLGLGLYQMGMFPLQGSPVVPIPQMHPQQFQLHTIPGPSAMHGMVAPMPINHPVPVPTPINFHPTQVGSSSDADATASANADGRMGLSSTSVKENPAIADPKAEIL